MGSQGLPPYAYAALYGSPKVCLACRANVASVKLAQTLIIPVFLQASIDNDFTIRPLQLSMNLPRYETSVQLAPGPGAMFSLEMTTTAQISLQV